MRALILCALGALSACNTPDMQNPETFYMRDMKLKVDGEKRPEVGAYVLPYKPQYQIKAYFYKKADVAKVRSCHREWVFTKPGDELEFTYTPDPILEQKENVYCPLEIGAFDTDGQHSWSFIDFKITEELVGELACNGYRTTAKGVTVCQARAGLVQRIRFAEKVTAYNVSTCPTPVATDFNAYTIDVAAGKCVYLFVGANKAKHRLTTLGYEDILTR